MTTVKRLRRIGRRLADAVALRRRNGRAGRLRLVGQRRLELAVRRGRDVGDQPEALPVLVGDDVDLVDRERPLRRQDQPRRPFAQRAVAHVA